MSREVSVLFRHATPLANAIYGYFSEFAKQGNLDSKVQFAKRGQGCNFLSIGGHPIWSCSGISRNSGDGELILFDQILVSTTEVSQRRFLFIFMFEKLIESRVTIRIKTKIIPGYAQAFRISDIKTPYAGEDVILLYRNGTYVMWKPK